MVETFTMMKGENQTDLIAIEADIDSDFSAIDEWVGHVSLLDPTLRRSLVSY